MAKKALIIGASGRVGSHLVQLLDNRSYDISPRLASSNPKRVSDWQNQGREAVLLNLNNADTYAPALKNVDSVFLLTGYSSDMLYQSKKLVDEAVIAGVGHIVHLGVFSSGQDRIPHFAWHDLVETYIKASGIAWTNLHPNVIADGALITKPSLLEKGGVTTFSVDVPQGWVFASDIAEVALTVLSEGKEKHGGKDYWLSTEVITGGEMARLFSEISGQTISCMPMSVEMFNRYIDNISDTDTRAYMQSAFITMQLSVSGQMQAQTVVRDDVQTVLGRKGLTMREWAQKYFQAQ